MSVSQQHQLPPPINPAILNGADEIVQWIQHERAQATVATRKAHEQIINQQSRNIEQLEIALQTHQNRLEQSTFNEKKMAEEHERVCGDLDFLCRALHEMGMYLSITYDQDQGISVRKLVVVDESWRDFLKGVVDLDVGEGTGALAGAGAGTDDLNPSRTVPEYASITTKDEPIQAALAIKILKDATLRDRMALANAKHEYTKMQKERDDQRMYFESQIESLDAKITSLLPPKFISPSQLLQGMQNPTATP